MEGLAEPVEAALSVGDGEGSVCVCVCVCVCDLPVHPGLTAANDSLGPLMLVFPSQAKWLCVEETLTVCYSPNQVCVWVCKCAHSVRGLVCLLSQHETLSWYGQSVCVCVCVCVCV